MLSVVDISESLVQGFHQRRMSPWKYRSKDALSYHTWWKLDSKLELSLLLSSTGHVHMYLLW